MDMESAKPEIGAAVRHTIGVDALRRLHRMIADERDADRRDAMIVRRIGITCAAVAALTVIWLVIRQA